MTNRKFRVSGLDVFGNRYYVVVYDGEVSVMSSSGTPYAFSTICSAKDDSMPLKFQLEDAQNVETVLAAVKKYSKLKEVQIA